MVSYFILLRNTFIMFLFASKEWPPHDMHRKRPVTRSFSIHLLSNYTRAKWHKRKPCHLEKLPSKRDSNNRNTPDVSCKNPCKSAEHASKYKPQNISQSSHIRISLTPFQTPPAIHYFVNSLPHRSPAPVIMPEFHCSDYHIR